LPGSGLLRGTRPRARKYAGTIAFAGAALALALFIAGTIRGCGDADRYGRVPVPGQAMLDLPAGDIAIYYEERVKLNEHQSLHVPDGLVVEARREQTVRSNRRKISNAINTDSRSLREFAKISIPEAGRYRVTTRSEESGFNSPAVTLGRGQLESLFAAVLSGAIAFGAGLCFALLALLLGRIGYEPPPPLSPAPRYATRRLPDAPSDMPAAPGYTQPTADPPSQAPPPASGWPPTTPSAWPSWTPPTPPPDPAEQLRELERQHGAGTLTSEEYQAKRQEVLDAL
jgi:hypothetical protein